MRPLLAPRPRRLALFILMALIVLLAPRAAGLLGQHHEAPEHVYPIPPLTPPAGARPRP